MDKFGARHIRHLPVYKLKALDRFRFASLSMIFQETGILVLSKLITDEFFENNKSWIEELIQNSQTTICCVISEDNLQPQIVDFINQFKWDEIPLNQDDL